MAIQRLKMIKKYVFLFIFLIIISGCSLSPGMHMDTESTWFENDSSVFVESLNKELPIEKIENNIRETSGNYVYKIGKGDQIAITVWGLPKIFPLANINPEQNLRRVDSNGNIFFPYVGLVKAENKTQNELRLDISDELATFFKDPQLDLSIVKFNSQRVYLLGEVSKPSRISLTDIPLSLTEALGQTDGINNNTANGKEIFIIRKGSNDSPPRIFIADLESPAGFISAGNFYLSDNDIVYVNAKGTARWNRVISQFFPFSSFLNSVDSLTSSD